MSNITHLLNWAKENGSEIDSRIDFQLIDSQVHVKTTLQIDNPDEVLFKVPLTLWVTEELSTKYFQQKGTEHLKLLIAKLKFDSSSTVVDGIDLSEKFKPYFQYLPSKLDIPLFWSDLDKALLKGTDAGIALTASFNTLLEQWKSVVQGIKHPEFTGDLAIDQWCSFPAYLWADGILSSRGFPAILYGQKGGFLLPVIDLLNHQNGVEVAWKHQLDAITFQTSQRLNKGDELYNNYGDKSNKDLLLSYGFVLAGNIYDTASLSLNVDESVLSKAKIENMPEKKGGTVTFVLSVAKPLPEPLVEFFGYISQLSSENQITLRSRLEGLKRLREIIEKKLVLFKRPGASGVVKLYKTGQKKIFQATFEQITSVEKALLKKYKPTLFLTYLKNDQPFMNSLLLTFGVTSLKDILAKNLLQQVLLLWVVRVSQEKQPTSVYEQFQQVEKTITITKEDVTEYLTLYRLLFPSLAQKIPEVYGGDWKIKLFVIAGTVIDRIEYVRPSNGEVYIIDKK